MPSFSHFCCYTMIFGVFISGCSTNTTPWTTYTDQDNNSKICLSNNDGMLSYDEFPFLLDHPVSYWEGQNKNIDYEVTLENNGNAIWDFRGNEEQDEEIDIVAHSIDENFLWYSEFFPAAMWYVEDAQNNHTLYSIDEDGIYVLGVASKEENPQNAGKNLVVYPQGEERTKILPFPLGVGSELQVDIEIENQTLNGFPFYGMHSYTTFVDDIGFLYIQNIGFLEAYRVHSSFEYQIQDQEPVLYRNTGFYVPCVGEVVRLASHENEEDMNFLSVSKIQRLKWDGF